MSKCAKYIEKAIVTKTFFSFIASSQFISQSRKMETATALSVQKHNCTKLKNQTKRKKRLQKCTKQKKETKNEGWRAQVKTGRRENEEESSTRRQAWNARSPMPTQSQQRRQQEPMFAHGHLRDPTRSKPSSDDRDRFQKCHCCNFKNSSCHPRH